MNQLLALVSFFLCLAFTPIVRIIAIKKGCLAHPSKERWHQKPTALLGGIAIYLAMACSLFVIDGFTQLIPHVIVPTNTIAPPPLASALWIGMTLIFLLGLLDDFIHIKPHTKLIGQILVASLTSERPLRFDRSI